MIDFLAAAAVLISGLLAVLAGVGLLRFPDVLTRLHAAAKAATVGLIAATLAAALEVDTVGAGALLLLVVALLFLSAPIGSSLLARAAYYDRDTPLTLTGRDDLAEDLQTGQSRYKPTEKSRYGDSRPGKASLLVGWLVVVWIALFSSGTAGVVLGGLALAAGVAIALPGYRPRWPQGLLKPVALLRFTLFFGRSLVAANLDVVRTVVAKRSLRPSIVRVPLRVSTRTETTLLVNAITFTPGTVGIEIVGDYLYVHILDLRDEDAFRREVDVLETGIIAAFGTSRERDSIMRSPNPS